VKVGHFPGDVKRSDLARPVKVLAEPAGNITQAWSTTSPSCTKAVQELRTPDAV